MATIFGTSGNDNLPRLTDPSTAGNDYIYGLGGNDTINGGAGNDYINGGADNDLIYGGAGNDTMVGSVGNDTYYASSTSDVIIEGVDAGTDSVYASASYSLSANVENLYLQGSAYYGYGNALNNYIVGNAGNNYLWGDAGNDVINGGAGNDTMAGGVGNDIYYVDSTSDVIIEGANAGTDYVYANASYTLGANVENLYMYGTAYYGYGNSLNNYIAGNSGNNYLWGAAGNDTITGGAGNDTIRGSVGIDVLTGGAGADYFNFYSTSEGRDTITDFSWGQGDKIALSDSGFGGSLTTTTGLTPGNLLSSQFRIGAGATTANHRVIYNSSTGALFFDSDGTGANAQVQIATLSTGLGLISSDFQVIA